MIKCNRDLVYGIASKIDLGTVNFRLLLKYLRDLDLNYVDVVHKVRNSKVSRITTQYILSFRA